MTIENIWKQMLSEIYPTFKEFMKSQGYATCATEADLVAWHQFLELSGYGYLKGTQERTQEIVVPEPSDAPDE